MTNALLFLATAFIWGTTWLAIKFQLGMVHPLWSVCYRFAISAGILMVLCYLKGSCLKFKKNDHKWFALQGLLLFSLNYLFYYMGTGYFVSGIVAVIFASVAMFNIFNGRIFLKIPLSKSAIAGCAIGLTGLAVIFQSEFLRLLDKDVSFIITGFLICLIGTAIASTGQIVATANLSRNLPVLETNAWGMTYGALYTALGAVVIGEIPTFDFNNKYVGSLLYLSIVGTVIAFDLYMRLVRNIGPGKAGYAFVLIPVIALTVSSVFEQFTWTMETFIGIFLVVTGNVVVMVSKAIQAKRQSKIKRFEEKQETKEAA
ncbi:MAG: EamA family transporter [Candidatus Paracaedibacteraceae bacterium]|nr:EamA family transporter [Candidatus Paracaedibacteraceae bacterium]